MAKGTMNGIRAYLADMLTLWTLADMAYALHGEDGFDAIADNAMPFLDEYVNRDGFTVEGFAELEAELAEVSTLLHRASGVAVAL